MQNDIRLLKDAVPPLLAWYGVSKRSLPWRGTHDPYEVLVSEIMLQQTRVEAVKGYYARFLARFPTAEALASASEEEVLKAWEGLGYYSRARNLQSAAKIIAASGFPKDFRGVRALPGVGDYTAGAVCSIAFGLPCPAVDGNVLRILTRLTASQSNIDEPATRKYFRDLLEAVYPEEAGDFCQALMELGALVCLPNGEPMCLICPWRELCRARLAGKTDDFPVRAEKKERKQVELDVFVLEKEGKYAVRQREKRGLLAGLWEFPNAPKDGMLPPGKIREVRQAKHIFTHIEWLMTGYLIEAETFDPRYVWATPKEIQEHYALPNAFKAFREWLK